MNAENRTGKRRLLFVGVSLASMLAGFAVKLVMTGGGGFVELQGTA
jgi:hypothetical protein